MRTAAAPGASALRPNTQAESLHSTQERPEYPVLSLAVDPPAPDASRARVEVNLFCRQCHHEGAPLAKSFAVCTHLASVQQC